MELEQYRQLSKMAGGVWKSELVFKNANVFFHIQGI